MMSNILTSFCYELQISDAMMSDSIQIQGLFGIWWFTNTKQDRNTNLIGGT